MKLRKTPAYLLIAFAVAVIGMSAATAQDDDPKDAGDYVITARIETMYLLNGDLNPFRINTTTEGGVVTLTGVVRELADKQLAERLAKTVDGVSSVNNQLTVDRSAETSDENREWRQKIEAANLNARIHRRLAYNAGLKDTMVDIDVNGDNVAVSGTVDSAEQEKEIVRIINDTSGVAEVESNLKIATDADTDDDVVADDKDDLGDKIARSDSIQTMSDEWVEKMVESSIIWDDNISIRNIDVEVNDGACILSGTVISEEQKERAEQVAKSTDGVKAVTNNITVL
jgi:osmotically-inducible protein OsmY